MRTKMSPRRALLTAVIVAVAPTLLFVIGSERLSPYLILTFSILVNWPIVRWLDDLQWYREWKRDPNK